MGRKDIEIGIEIAGIRKFERTVNRFEKEFIRKVKRVIVETAKLIKSQAQALAPEDDGNLRKSIEIEYFNGGLSARISVGAHYGVYVEYGTGIYAVEGNGRKTPWAYRDPEGRYDEKGNPIFIWTRGMHAQPYWAPAIEIGSKYFERELNKLGA